MENYENDKEATSVILTLTEDLVASVVPKVRSEMKDLIGGDVVTLTVDMAQVTMVDSSGIGCLVAAHNSLVRQNGQLMIINMSPDIYELFLTMRLDRHFSISRSA